MGCLREWMGERVTLEMGEDCGGRDGLQSGVDYLAFLLSAMDKSQTIFGYLVGKKLGEGSFGQVLLGQKQGEKVAIKKISKKQIIKVNKLHEPFIQKQILLKLNLLFLKEPLFVKIHETESDEEHVYLILQYCQGGTLENMIYRQNLSISDIRHLAAKILIILQKLHDLGIVHRDLKPSNFLLTQQGYLKLSDFGTAYAPDSFFSPEVAQRIKGIKEMNQAKEDKDKKDSETAEKIQQRRSTFVGTACYMAPELLANDLCGKEADIWAFGCILYEMIFKKSPFFDNSEGMVWKKILNDEIQYDLPAEMKDKEEARQVIDLIKQILVKEIQKRLGSGVDGYKYLHSHPFFAQIDWEKQAFRSLNPICNLAKSNTQEQPSMKKVQKVLLSGVVKKKMFFGNFTERTLILYSTPKLVYYETDSGEKKGEIKLQKNTPIVVEGKVFTVTNQKKTYYFKSKTSGEWVEMIRSAIVNAYY